MGVMPCSRKDCDNIMCDTYVDGIGYVCYDCQKEFKEFSQRENSDDDRENVDIDTEGNIRKKLSTFMETPKDNYKDNMSVEDFFNKHTRN